MAVGTGAEAALEGVVAKEAVQRAGVMVELGATLVEGRVVAWAVVRAADSVIPAGATAAVVTAAAASAAAAAAASVAATVVAAARWEGAAGERLASEPAPSQPAAGQRKSRPCLR